MSGTPGTPPGRWDQMAARFDFAGELANEQRKHREHLERLLLGLLGVMDAVERMSADGCDEPSAVIPARSVRLLGKELAGVLGAAGVWRLERVGKQLDPDRDEVVETRPAGAESDGRVIGELSGGYQWDGAVLRRARVVVAKHNETQP